MLKRYVQNCEKMSFSKRFQSLKNIEATLFQFVNEELGKGERERIGAEEIERNWFCDL